MKPFSNYSPQMQNNIARNMRAAVNVEGTIEDWVKALQQINPVLKDYPEYPAPVVSEVALVVEGIISGKKTS